MDKPRKLRSWLASLAAALGLLIPAAPASAAEAGVLNVLVPSAPIAFNGSFSMTINFANNGTTAIVDPDIALYIQARNSGGAVQPLLPDHVTITAPSIPIYKWNTGSGTQVGVKFFPDVHSNLAPGWNSNYIFTVAVAMPAGTTSLALGVRAWKSSNPSDVYRTWNGQVAVNPLPPPPPPAPPTSSPTPRPRPSSAAPTSAVPAPTETASPLPSPEATGSPIAFPVISAEPQSIVTLPVSSSGPSWGLLIGGIMVAISLGILLWLVLRWRQRQTEPTDA